MPKINQTKQIFESNSLILKHKMLKVNIFFIFLLKYTFFIFKATIKIIFIILFYKNVTNLNFFNLKYLNFVKYNIF